MPSSIAPIVPAAGALASAATGSTAAVARNTNGAGGKVVEADSVRLGTLSQAMIKAYPPYAVFRSMSVRDHAGRAAGVMRWPISEENAALARADVAGALGVSAHAGTNQANIDASSLQPLVERAARTLQPLLPRKALLS